MEGWEGWEGEGSSLGRPRSIILHYSSRFGLGCDSIVVISIKESGPPESDSQRYEPNLAQSSLSLAFC